MITFRGPDDTPNDPNEPEVPLIDQLLAAMSEPLTTTYAITTRDGRSGWLEVLDGRIESGFFVWPKEPPTEITFREDERMFDSEKFKAFMSSYNQVNPRIQP